ncbi:MAG TPA: hypothetical protein VK206_06435 [Anaerolineales bacterium]|nr:hypothetical protein [Anaerolineales bacterium]
MSPPKKSLFLFLTFVPSMFSYVQIMRVGTLNANCGMDVHNLFHDFFLKICANGLILILPIASSIYHRKRRANTT